MARRGRVCIAWSPWHGLPPDSLPDIEVHGGVTFADAHEPTTYAAMALGDNRAEGVTWWLGFDCAHGFDLVPRFHRQAWMTDETFKDLDYVKAECAHLARQVIEAMALR